MQINIYLSKIFCLKMILPKYCLNETSKNDETRYRSGFHFHHCREDRIRTCDHMTPSHVRYRAALLPETLQEIIILQISFYTPVLNFTFQPYCFTSRSTINDLYFDPRHTFRCKIPFTAIMFYYPFSEVAGRTNIIFF